MIPDTTPFTQRTAEYACADCGAALAKAGVRATEWRCRDCICAAYAVVARRQPGQSVRPSDVAAMRED